MRRAPQHDRRTQGHRQKRGYPGHQEIELALVKLYRLTGDRRCLVLAAYFINERGNQTHYFTEEALARGDDPKSYWAGTHEYNKSHVPVHKQTRMFGPPCALRIWPHAWPTLHSSLAMSV